MASEYKKRKLKSKFVSHGELKRKKGRCKHVAFYTPSERLEIKSETEKLIEEEKADGTLQ